MLRQRLIWLKHKSRNNCQKHSAERADKFIMSTNLLTLLGLLCLIAAVGCAAVSFANNTTALRIPALVLMGLGLVCRLVARRR